MPEPTLSEIVNAPVDPQLGTGTPAVVFNNQDLVHTLNNAAQFKAENDWRKYNTFLGNLKEVYKNLDEVAKQPVMTEDRDYLKQKMAGIVKSIADDPHGFFGGGGKYQDILSQVSQLESDTTESKQNQLYDEAHRNFFYRNPDLDTPQNQALIQGYRAQKLGSRQPYLLKLPSLFDPQKIASGINPIAKTDFAQDEVTPDNQFIKSTTGTKYDPLKYNDAVGAFYDSSNPDFKNTLKERFGMLPDAVKQQYLKTDDPLKSYFSDIMSKFRMGDNLKTDLKPNSGFLKPQELGEKIRHDKIMEGIAGQKANKYSDYINGKLSNISNSQKQLAGYWGSVVDKLQNYNIKQDDNSGYVNDDYVFAGDLPAGFRAMSGIGKDGKPVELLPFETSKGVQYYKTKYYRDGNQIDKNVLQEKYRLSKGQGYTGTYDNYVKDLIKKGVMDLELLGRTNQEDGTDENGHKKFKEIPATATFQSSMESARALNNKINSDKEEPIFPPDDQGDQ